MISPKLGCQIPGNEDFLILPTFVYVKLCNELAGRLALLRNRHEFENWISECEGFRSRVDSAETQGNVLKGTRYTHAS